MIATTHSIFGVAALAGAGLALGIEPPVWAYPVAAVAAWLPDVDNPRSKLGNGLSRRKNPLLNGVTRPISWGLRAASFGLFRTVGHRTLTHSLLGLFLFFLPVYLLLGFSPALQLALLAGVGSHIVADALNTWGVPVLWPIKKNFRLIPRGIRSGGAAELIVAALMVGVSAYAIYSVYPAVGETLGLTLPTLHLPF
ncbi:MAG: metal-dependent hydrolase [Rubrobacter sp.]